MELRGYVWNIFRDAFLFGDSGREPVISPCPVYRDLHPMLWSPSVSNSNDQLSFFTLTFFPLLPPFVKTLCFVGPTWVTHGISEPTDKQPYSCLQPSCPFLSPWHSHRLTGLGNIFVGILCLEHSQIFYACFVFILVFKQLLFAYTTNFKRVFSDKSFTPTLAPTKVLSSVSVVFLLFPPWS